MIFFFTVFSLAGYNHLFTSKKRNQIVPSALSNPIEETVLSELDQIEIINPRLNVTLDKKGNTWILTEPKKFPLQGKIISDIISNLKAIKITKIYPDDTLNRENFRVATGLSSIKLRTPQETIEVLFGLNNSVDRTSYIRIINQNTIFQIETLQLDFASIVLNDLININLFSFPKDSLAEVMINKGSQTKWPKIGIVKDPEGNWTNTYSRKLNPEKVNDYIQRLSEIKFSHLIDEREKDLEEKLEQIFRYPQFNLKFVTENKTVNALISRAIVYDIPSLNVEKDRFVMIKFEDNPLLYLMPKKNLDFFEDNKTAELR